MLFWTGTNNNRSAMKAAIVILIVFVIFQHEVRRVARPFNAFFNSAVAQVCR